MADLLNKGYWGKLVEVDLNTHTITITDRHMQYVEQHLGGRGLGARLLWEALKETPGSDPMSEKNPVMFLPGPITGLAVPFASRYEVCSQSAITRPLNNPYDNPTSTVGFGACGGHFGPNLKWCGFDGVYITGKSKTPVVLKLTNNKAELVDATECWGLDIPEAQEWAKGKYGVEFATSFIGPAAERGVRWADICGDTGRAAGRGGSAAVLGARNFKGIIAFGTQMTPIDDEKRLIEVRRNYYNSLYAWSGLESFRRWGTMLHPSMNSYQGLTTTKNSQYGESPYDKEAGVYFYQNDFFARHRTCIGCVTRCMKFGIVRTGKYKGTIYEGPDYEGAVMNGHDWLIKTGEEVAYLGEYIESQGMDCITTGAVIGFMIEAVEKGYIKPAQIDNIPLDWGATDAIHDALEQIIYNTTNPFWDVVRLGIMPMIDWLVENNKCDYNEVRDISAQNKNNGFAAWWSGGAHIQGVNYALATRGACHQIGMYSVASAGKNIIRDSGVFCSFASNGGLSGPAWYESLNIALGFTFTDEQWVEYGLRSLALEKCFNVVNGFRRADDIPPARLFTVSPEKYDDGTPLRHPGKCMTPEYLDETTRTCYKGWGWDEETGIPTKGFLRECGLEEVIPYVEKALALTNEKMPE